MLAVVTAFIASHLFLTTITYLLSELSFKESAVDPVTFLLSLMVGWVPSVIVYSDLEKAE
jgi:uncharacterized membrane protein YciS (DUF1049 family)